MRRMIYIALMGLLLLGGTALLPKDAQAQDESDGVSVTIYNQSSSLIQDRRTVTFEAGINTFDFTDVAALIDKTSVSFRSLTDPAGTNILEQNFIYDSVSTNALLVRYRGEQISVTSMDGTVFSGALLNSESNYQNSVLLLQLDDGTVVTLNLNNVRDIHFPALPTDLVTWPTLRWVLNSANGGEQQVELTYLTNGMNWTADYILLLARDNSSIDLNGWMTLTNGSGRAFENANVKVVAGVLNRIPPPQLAFGAYADEAQAMIATATPAPAIEQRDFSEYKLYAINRPVTLANGEIKQIEFVTANDVAARTYYVYNASTAFYNFGEPMTEQSYGQSRVTQIENWLEFDTGEASGLGEDLPAGRVRVYQEDVDGAALLIGENTIDHTPEGETVRFRLGNAFDLVGERVQTDFETIGDNVLEETYQITLRNRKADASVQIRVPEHLFRWGNWEIVDADTAYTQTDAETIEFLVDVAPNGETVITYTVRYSW